MKSEWTIKRELTALRRLIDNPATPDLEQRIAYEVEMTLRWVLFKTARLGTRAQSVQDCATVIRADRAQGFKV